MLASLMAAPFIVAQAVNMIHLFALWKTLGETDQELPKLFFSWSFLPSTKHETREQPLEESKITFELIPLLKSQQDDCCLLGLAPHHSETFVIYALVVPMLLCKAIIFVWRDKVCL